MKLPVLLLESMDYLFHVHGSRSKSISKIKEDVRYDSFFIYPINSLPMSLITRHMTGDRFMSYFCELYNSSANACQLLCLRVRPMVAIAHLILLIITREVVNCQNI